MDDLNTEDCIAIIGAVGRFPGAEDLDGFWDLLKRGVEPLRHFTDAELVSLGVPLAMISDRNAVKRAIVLDDAESFDAGFFGYTDGQARAIDPQQRVLLEMAWAAIERAGYDVGRIDGPVGLYASCSPASYLPPASPRGGVADLFRARLDVGQDFLATRVSYKLDLTGPSLTVQTACSSSLVAVHLACQGLLMFDCEVALAGGVSISFPQLGYIHQKGHITSPDGRCRAYDIDAGGVMPGRGGGVVVLKRLADALRDRDTICAVIRGSAVNNDGNRKVGYTAPAIDGQVAVIEAALAHAGLDPADISLIEGHGTGTGLGDAIELTALLRVFGANPPGSCALGSVKANIGHLDAAAGIAGLIKAVLCLENRALAPSINFTAPNAIISATDCPIEVVRQVRPWLSAGPRRAGVSAFGIGGTNAHVILEEAPRAVPGTETPGPQLFVLSARSPEALQVAADRLAAFVAARPDARLADIAYTLQVGRKAFAFRSAVVAADVDQLISGLRAKARVGHVAEDRPLTVSLGFNGGLDATRDGLEALYLSEPDFRTALRDLLGQLDPSAAERISEAVRFGAAGAEPDIRGIAGLAGEVAMGALWRRWGIAGPAIAITPAGGLSKKASEGEITFAEAVAALGRGEQSPGASDGQRPADLLALEADRKDRAHLLAVLGELWVRGLVIGSPSGDAGAELRRTPLPTYPFERTDFSSDQVRLRLRSDESARSDGEAGRAPPGSIAVEAAAPRPAAAAAFEAMTELERAIREIWQAAIGVDPIGLDDNFFEIGGDSMVGVQILAEVEQLVGLELELLDILEKGATVRSLANAIAEKLIGAGEEELHDAGMEL
jgi:phthiocerol/phenolphthiocerol synthesis type-I polyketide synthase E